MAGPLESPQGRELLLSEEGWLLPTTPLPSNSYAMMLSFLRQLDVFTSEWGALNSVNF